MKFSSTSADDLANASKPEGRAPRAEIARAPFGPGKVRQGGIGLNAAELGATCIFENRAQQPLAASDVEDPGAHRNHLRHDARDFVGIEGSIDVVAKRVDSPCNRPEAFSSGGGAANVAVDQGHSPFSNESAARLVLQFLSDARRASLSGRRPVLLNGPLDDSGDCLRRVLHVMSLRDFSPRARAHRRSKIR